MLFTVFQYLPFLEEETPGHRTELTKKAKESDTPDTDDGDGDDDSSDDDDLKTDLIFSLINTYSFNKAAKDNFYIKALLYQSLVKNINTPPPKA